MPEGQPPSSHRRRRCPLPHPPGAHSSSSGHIYAAGPLTNIALAISITDFAALTEGIVLMGGSLNPQTDDPEFAADPRPSSISGSIPRPRTSCFMPMAPC